MRAVSGGVVASGARGARSASAGIAPGRVAVGVRLIVDAVECGVVGRVELGEVGAVVELRALNGAGARTVWALDASGCVVGDGVIVPLVGGHVDLERPRQLTVLRGVVRRALVAAVASGTSDGVRDRIASSGVGEDAGGEGVAAPPLIALGGEIAPGRDGSLFEFAWA